VVVNRIGNFVRLALRARVKPAYDALQFRELTHHFRSQIALGEFGSPVGFRYVGERHPEIEPLLRQPACDGADAFDFVSVTA